jgi:hypothetical protein
LRDIDGIRKVPILENEGIAYAERGAPGKIKPEANK